MQLLCIGDVAVIDETVVREDWGIPNGLTPGGETRVLLNWELPIGDKLNPVPRSSGARILAHPISPAVLRTWSPGFATLATNHILDAGEEGLTGTICALNRVGFTTMGAGRTREEITQPLFWDTADGRLVVLNWVFPETHPDWMAVPGPNCWPGSEEARGIISDLKHRADWVVIVVHWSDELFPYPRPEERALARELAEMGADIIVGHHPHVVRGAEVFGSCQVFYSIGNFYFSDIPDGRGGWIWRGAPRNREGLALRFSLQRGHEPVWVTLSFWQTGRQAVLDPDQRAARRMEQVSRPLRRFPGSEYAGWYAARRARFDWWGYRWHFGLWNTRKLGRLAHLLRRDQRKGHLL